MGFLQASKKRCGTTPSTIFSFFGSIVPYNKDDPHQKQFEEDLGCHHKSSRLLWRLGLPQKSSYSKRLLSSSMSLPFVMEGKIIGSSRLCSKSLGLGNGPSWCWYLGAYGSTMCVKPKLGLLVAFECSYFYYISCMSNVIRLHGTWF
jgi:hypothetical protein